MFSLPSSHFHAANIHIIYIASKSFFEKMLLYRHFPRFAHSEITIIPSFLKDVFTRIPVNLSCNKRVNTRIQVLTSTTKASPPLYGGDHAEMKECPKLCDFGHSFASASYSLYPVKDATKKEQYPKALLIL